MVVSTRPEQDEPSWPVNIDMGSLKGPRTEMNYRHLMAAERGRTSFPKG